MSLKSDIYSLGIVFSNLVDPTYRMKNFYIDYAQYYAKTTKTGLLKIFMSKTFTIIVIIKLKTIESSPLIDISPQDIQNILGNFFNLMTHNDYQKRPSSIQTELFFRTCHLSKCVDTINYAPNNINDILEAKDLLLITTKGFRKKDLLLMLLISMI